MVFSTPVKFCQIWKLLMGLKPPARFVSATKRKTVCGYHQHRGYISTVSYRSKCHWAAVSFYCGHNPAKLRWSIYTSIVAHNSVQYAPKPGIPNHDVGVKTSEFPNSLVISRYPYVAWLPRHWATEKHGRRTCAKCPPGHGNPKFRWFQIRWVSAPMKHRRYLSYV